MIELDDLTVREFTNLEDQGPYLFAMKFAFRYADPVDEYQIGDLMEMPFGFIKDLQFDIENGITWDQRIDYVLQATRKNTIADENLAKVCRFMNYLIKGVEKIIEIEADQLAHDPTADEMAAGMDRFKHLGIYLQIRSLTGGDVTKVDEVRALKYSLCFTELFAAKQLYEYQRELIKVTTPRGKTM